jgi:exodeoxyribonuclease-3
MTKSQITCKWIKKKQSAYSNKGLRIDYCMVAEALRNNMVNAGIMQQAMHSDHCPVWVEVK